jgi:hypothetical protein
MALTIGAINRATLARQLLLGRAPVTPPEAVRQVGAVQAQEPASAYLALWNRVAGFDPADLDAAFADRAVVRASLMRITLHAVHAEDYPAFHAAMLPSLRASRLNDRRYTSTGLTADDADEVLPHVLADLTEPRTGPEVAALLADRLGRHEDRLWWALRTFAPLHHVPTGGPWSFRTRASFIAACTHGGPPGSEQAAAHLVRRYLEAFGPATRQDIAQFTMLRQPVVRAALHAVAGQLDELEGPDGATLVDVRGAPRPPDDIPAPPRLLPMWDSVLLAHADRRRILPPDHRALVIRRNGDVLPSVLVDGYVAGVWRPVDGGIEVTAFRRLDDVAWDGLEAESRLLGAFLADREPDVYRRYGRWWDALPNQQVRVLPA